MPPKTPRDGHRYCLEQTRKRTGLAQMITHMLWLLDQRCLNSGVRPLFMSANKPRPDLVDAVVLLVFWLRVGTLAVFGIILTCIGLLELRPSNYLLGAGLCAVSIADYWLWHPSKPTGKWFIPFATAGLLLCAASFLVASDGGAA
jgi:hypothetical protein